MKINVNLQHILSMAALVTYGLTDSLTSAMMMTESNDPYLESNPIISYIYIVQGFWGVVIFKLLAVFILIMVIYRIQNHYKTGMYWKINGVFVSILILGILGTMANIRAMEGLSLVSPSIFILSYIIMVVSFINIGDCVDNYIEKKGEKQKEKR